jgi:hypothetical protein
VGHSSPYPLYLYVIIQATTLMGFPRPQTTANEPQPISLKANALNIDIFILQFYSTLFYSTASFALLL